MLHAHLERASKNIDIHYNITFLINKNNTYYTTFKKYEPKN